MFCKVADSSLSAETSGDSFRFNVRGIESLAGSYNEPKTLLDLSITRCLEEEYAVFTCQDGILIRNLVGS